jgi:hypothetical protein
MSLSHVDSIISAAVFAALLAGGCAGSPPPAGVDASSGSDGAIADAPPSDGRPPTDAPPPPPTDARPTTDAPPPPPDARPPTTCAIADVAWLPSVNQYLVVSTTGRALRLDADGGLISNQPFAAYAGLAAACGASGAGCQLDAVTARSPTQILVVAYGTLWTLDQNLAAVAQQPLTSVPGVAAGPCAGVAGTCHVEALTWRDDTQQYLVIARGNVYSLDATGALGRDLADDVVRRPGRGAVRAVSRHLPPGRRHVPSAGVSGRRQRRHHRHRLAQPVQRRRHHRRRRRHRRAHHRPRTGGDLPVAHTSIVTSCQPTRGAPTRSVTRPVPRTSHDARALAPLPFERR